MKHFDRNILDVANELADAYVEVFTAPPWKHEGPEATRAEFLQRLAADTRRPDFRAVLALSDTGAVDGFAIGWTTHSPFRTDRSYPKISDRLGPDRVKSFLVGALEIDELGVRPDARGTGLGRRLLSAITSTEPSGRAWLVTWNQAHDTLAFYRRVGWQEPAPVPGDDSDIVVFLSPG